MNAFESLIADSAKMTGLPLSPDERGGCALETDGIFITIQYRQTADDIVMFAPVTDPDAAGETADDGDEGRMGGGEANGPKGDISQFLRI